MKTKEYLQLLQSEIHSTSMATLDVDGRPEIRVIDIMLADENSLYFLTAKGKDFYRQLTAQQYVAVSGTKDNIAVSVKGKVRVADSGLLKEMFLQNSYMETIYPGGTRSALVAFQLYEGQGEYWDINARPVYHDHFILGASDSTLSGYRIGNNCIGCGACLKVCPQQCIEQGRPFTIRQEHCIHCGNCTEVCPSGAARSVCHGAFAV